MFYDTICAFAPESSRKCRRAVACVILTTLSVSAMAARPQSTLPVPAAQSGQVGRPSRSTPSAPSPADKSTIQAVRKARAAIRAGANEVDFDGSGKKKMTLVRDPKGAIMTVLIDAEGQGNPSIMIDVMSEPQTLTMMSKGQIVRMIQVWGKSGPKRMVQTMTPADKSTPARRITYELDSTNATFKYTIETDKKRDGTYSDGTVRGTAPLGLGTQEQQLLNYPEPPSTFPQLDSSCKDPVENARIEDAFTTMLNQGKMCLAAQDPNLAVAWLAFFVLANPRITCGETDPPGGCAQSPDLFNPLAIALGGFVGLGPRIVVTQKGVNTNGAACGAGSLAEVLFHESMHYVLGPHAHPEMKAGYDDPNDRVYACERQCFGKSTPQTCATCFDVSSCSTQNAPSVAKDGGCVMTYSTPSNTWGSGSLRCSAEIALEENWFPGQSGSSIHIAGTDGKFYGIINVHVHGIPKTGDTFSGGPPDHYVDIYNVLSGTGDEVRCLFKSGSIQLSSVTPGFSPSSAPIPHGSGIWQLECSGVNNWKEPFQSTSGSLGVTF